MTIYLGLEVNAEKTISLLAINKEDWRLSFFLFPVSLTKFW